MKNIKKEILENHCYTELVYNRINKKLVSNLSKKESESFIIKVIRETDEKHFKKIGKNFYILNKDKNIKITVNSNTFRIITVDRLDKKRTFK